MDFKFKSVTEDEEKAHMLMKILKLTERNSALCDELIEARQPWKEVTEHLPASSGEKIIPVFVMWEDEDIQSVAYWSSKHKHFQYTYSLRNPEDICYPTHWMPIPKIAELKKTNK
jgi:hypothetical protein